MRSGAENSPRRQAFARGKSQQSGARRQGRGPSAFESAPRRPVAVAPARSRYCSAGSRRRRLRRASTQPPRLKRTRAESQKPRRARRSLSDSCRKFRRPENRGVGKSADARRERFCRRRSRRSAAAATDAATTGANRESSWQLSRHRRSRDATMPRRGSDHGAHNHPDCRSATSAPQLPERSPAPTLCTPTPTIPRPTSVLMTDARDGIEGHGMTFTLGRGNEVVVAAVRGCSTSSSAEIRGHRRQPGRVLASGSPAKASCAGSARRKARSISRPRRSSMRSGICTPRSSASRSGNSSPT